MRTLQTGLAMLASVACAPAGAQEQAPLDVLGSLGKCRTIASPEARLACFDYAAARIEAAVRAEEVTIVGRQDVQKARRSLFGFSLPRIPLFGVGGRNEDRRTDTDFLELKSTVAGVRPLANGRIELRLAEEDAVWQTTDPLAFPPKIGTAVRIRRGALGNYFIALQGARSIRGLRVR